MKIFFAIFNDFKIFFNPKTKFGKRRLIGLGSLILVFFILLKVFSNDTSEQSVTTKLTEVEVRSVSELSSKASFDTVGKVEAISEANLQVESGGRVTAVNVNVGDTIAAGAVVATLENSAERAALLQAQGSYEAALAASAQSGVGVNEAQTGVAAAENGAINAFRAAFNTVNSIVYNSIDPFFGNPASQLPGLKIDGAGFTTTLNTERVAYQSLLPEWQRRSQVITGGNNLDAELSYAKLQVERTIALTDMFIAVFNQGGAVGGYTESDLQAYSTNFTALRATLIGTRTSLDNALSTLVSARDAKRRADLTASGGVVSASDAQIKIALGALQTAQSAYQKTIVRSPIQGVVNALYLKAGDYVSPTQPAAVIANNNGLQIKAFVNEIDNASLSVGNVVSIEGGASGIITAKADALDPTNGKVAVVVGVNPNSGLTNGATVKVTFSQVSETKVDERIIVPLSALKITPDGAAVFTVTVDGKLEAVPVIKGQLFGDNIEITSGISKDTRIVTDARGLKNGQVVLIK